MEKLSLLEQETYLLLETKSQQLLFQVNKETILTFYKKKLAEMTRRENQVLLNDHKYVFNI
jgi:hypothetical protein